MFTTNSGRFISYYGREHTLDIQRQDGNNPTISTIDQLFNVLLNVWCKETRLTQVVKKIMIMIMTLHTDNVQ